jgi:hypothetical protein
MNNEAPLIIKNSRNLFLNPYLSTLPFIDKKIVEDLKKTLIDKNLHKHGTKIIKLLNVYFYLENINLTHLEFKNKNLDYLFNDFLKFITANLITNERKVRQAYRNNLIRMIDILNKKRTGAIQINKEITFDNSYNFSKFEEKLKMLNGITINKGKDITGFNAVKYGNHFSLKEAFDIYNKIKIFENHNCLNRSVLNLLDLYLDFLVEKNIKLVNTTDKLMGEFIFLYFKDLEQRKLNIQNHKPIWNSFIVFIKDVFNLNIDESFLKIKTQKRMGNSANIKINKNKKIVKNKLITEVPLEVSDEKSMCLLKDKCFQDIDILQEWSREIIKDYKKQQKIGKYPSKEFFIESPEKLRSKYKMWHDGGFKKWVENNFNTNAILNKTHMTAIVYLLIINNPIITSSFIKDLKINSIIKTDQGTYLVGKKRRKGKEFSEQKILLNKESLELVNLLAENYKKMKDFSTSDSLMLHVTPMSMFKIFPFEKHKMTETLRNSITVFIKNNYNFKENNIDDFINKINLSSIRSTCAINVFFKYESAKKMAEVLGHENYNSSLLTHYLPEPIIHFYQSRWIRIFQKGIIYEAMKDNENVLKAVGFKDMEALDEFLRNHTIKNLPMHDSEKEKSIKENKECNECYVSINEENLTALLSIKSAVDNSNRKEEINEKAFFWKSFAEHLISEIENNKIYYTFKEVLSVAIEESHKNIKLYTKVIYD